ncbi:hypothetical protein [Spongiibacter tropicus]|uniref:hypothetical protein n=1 Tax=Spongiibacter tropicus TaxID=454602 RepID=UPI0023549D26|nr:hypothetical protein [Spongiibacter tropicus]
MGALKIVAAPLLLEVAPVDPRNKAVERLYSASELLDQVRDVLENPDLDEWLNLNHLFRALNDHDERCTDLGYEGFGAWCDRLVAEARLPNRELGSDGFFEMRLLLSSELRRVESLVVS